MSSTCDCSVCSEERRAPLAVRNTEKATERPGGEWVLGGVGGSVTAQAARDGDEMCSWECMEIEARSCPNMGLPCKSRWDRYHPPPYQVFQTWGFVESCLGIFGSFSTKIPLKLEVDFDADLGRMLDD